MPQDKELTFKRLNELWYLNDFAALETEGNKYIIFSDLHLGNGEKADDFRGNEQTLLSALKYYRGAGYKLILLGDIEELWQFALPEIKARYEATIYQTIRDFGDNNTYRIFGNHDCDWCIQPDPVKSAPYRPAQPTEAMKLKDRDGRARILLVHGHQGSLESDKNSWSSRFCVRAFRLVEPLVKKFGLTRHPPAIKCEIVKDYEQIMYSWAKSAKALLICGHSHNAIFASMSYADRLREKISALEADIRNNPSDKELIKRAKEQISELSKKIDRESKNKRDIIPTETGASPLPIYFNTGCGLYEDGITGIEILNGNIRLAKWHRDPILGPRYEIYQEESLNDFLSQISRE
ncbi:MAG: metallophosphoesterase [Desulfobacterales bacterium]|nr:metallophosphoesterase [Desulfobacterales bacterium]